MNIQTGKYSVFLLLLIIACSHPKKESIEVVKPRKKPVMLLVEKEIDYKVLDNYLSQPFGLAVDFKGFIYVSDAGNNRLVRFKPDITPDREIGGYGKQAELFDHPTFLTFDNGLNLMVSDEGNRRISRYDSHLNFVDELPYYDYEDPLKFGYPSGIAFTRYGETWVADREKNRIAIFNNIGRFDRFLGDFGYPGGQLAVPEKIVKDNDNNFIVCDAGNGRLVVYDTYGNFSKQIAHDEFDYPISVTVDRKHLWVLDGAVGLIFFIDPKGKIIFRTGPNLPGSSNGLKEPSDIIILPDERLIITDTGNNCILVCRIIYEDD